MTPLLEHTRDARGVHRVSLADPARLNVLSQAMLTQLAAVVADVAADGDSRALVIAAQGKAFCAGHDLREMAGQTQAGHVALFRQCARFMLSLSQLPVPVIAVVQGVAAAAGCQLVAQCDLAIASKAARFGVNGIDLGLFCATPSVPLLRNVPWKSGMHMLMTGDFASAPRALEMGLVSQVCEPDQLDVTLETLLGKLLAKPRNALAMGKSLVQRQRTMGQEAAYELAAQTMAENLALAETAEGVLAFVEKRAPKWH